MDCSLSILFLLTMAAVADAAVSPQDYWNSMLPGTPMPAAVRQLLLADEGTGLIGIGVDALATAVVGKGRVTNFYHNGLRGASVTNFHQMGLSVAGLANAKLGNPRVSNFYHKVRGMQRLGDADNSRGRVSNIYQKADSFERRSSADNIRARVSNFYQKSDATEGLAEAENGRARVSTLYQKGISGKGIAIDNNTGSGTTLEKQKSIDMVDGANFFLEKDLRPGMKMRLDFSRCTPEAVFIPRPTASSVPFSSEKLPHILSYFSVQPNSVEAEIMRTTLEDCEEVDSSVESKYCPTSVESMVDYATSALGTRSITAVSSEFAKLGAAKQEYLVLGSSSIQKLHGTSCVACHQQPYPYAVFYCHVTRATKAYVVPLVGMDGARVDAVAVCHTDTSAWNPSHLAFRVLKVRPGKLPICHFLPQDGLVWAPREEALPALFDN